MVRWSSSFRAAAHGSASLRVWSLCRRRARFVASPIAGAAGPRALALSCSTTHRGGVLPSSPACPLPTAASPLLLVSSRVAITQPLSNPRRPVPLIVPKPLWERANAIDSNGYVVASIVGPALAGTLVAGLGAPTALAVTASIFAVAAVVAIGLRDPGTRGDSGRLLADAWRGLVYVTRHPTLRALALSVSTANLGWGVFFLTLPVLVLRQFGGGPEFVGLLFAMMGISGSVSVLLMGRVSASPRA